MSDDITYEEINALIDAESKEYYRKIHDKYKKKAAVRAAEQTAKEDAVIRESEQTSKEADELAAVIRESEQTAEQTAASLDLMQIHAAVRADEYMKYIQICVDAEALAADNMKNDAERARHLNQIFIRDNETITVPRTVVGIGPQVYDNGAKPDSDLINVMKCGSAKKNNACGLNSFLYCIQKSNMSESDLKKLRVRIDTSCEKYPTDMLESDSFGVWCQDLTFGGVNIVYGPRVPRADFTHWVILGKYDPSLPIYIIVHSSSHFTVCKSS
jgi:hypothetical protein